jgi:dihydrofolate reductase
MIRFIAAIDSKRGLADDNGIPWDLPTDRKFFVEQTQKGIILMGKGTYQEFKKPMHGRTNYVATFSDEKLLSGFEAVNDVPAFYEQHKDEVINNIGGAGLFSSTLDYADELIITQLEADFNCTKFFPKFDHKFKLVSKSKPHHENGITYYFEVWKAKKTN